jgi:hypothetical protein
MNDFHQEYSSYLKTLKEVNERNKQALFAALATTPITSITVDFNGEGDSGQIDDVIAYTNSDPVPIPEMQISLEYVGFGSTSNVTLRPPCTLQEAIQDACYGYLEHTHGGWENNDGAYGTFEIDVSERTIDLEFNGRYTAIETSSHTF